MQMNLDLTMQPRRRLKRRCTEDFMGNGGTSIQFVIQPPNSSSTAPWRRDFFIYFQFWVGGKKMKSSSSELLYFVWHEFFWQCRQQAEFDHEEIHSGVEVICEIMICTIKSLLGEWEGTQDLFKKIQAKKVLGCTFSFPEFFKILSMIRHSRFSLISLTSKYAVKVF